MPDIKDFKLLKVGTNPDKEGVFLGSLASENGFNNSVYGCTVEQYKAIVMPLMLGFARGENLKPWEVPQTTYYLYYKDEIVGMYKLRHRLTNALRRSGGHIGYAIGKEHRGKGYGKIGLSLAIPILRSFPDYEGEYVLIDCNCGNIASRKVILANHGVLFREDDSYEHFFIDERGEFSDHPSFDPDAYSITEAPELLNFTKKKLLITFFLETLEKWKMQGLVEEFLKVEGENSLVIYRHKKSDVLIMPGIVGEPACCGFADDLILNGIDDVLFVGGAGVLDSSLKVGQVLLVKEAIRDEGFSYHYFPSSKKILANESGLNRNKALLNKKGVPYKEVTTWTTDAFHRETKGKIAKMQELGASCVEMEQAGMIALAHFRCISYAAMLYAGDDVSGETWNQRLWRDRSDVRSGLMELAIEALLS